MGSRTTVHRFQATLFPVNAYLVETASGVVAIDATLGVSDARALRARADALGKPFLGVIVTHSHPDHYGGVAALLDGATRPVCAVAGVDQIIRRDDEAKDRILRPMFGAEWATVREFPNRLVADGERLTLGDATFQVIDAGPCESPHDSWWILEAEGPPQVFVGDLVYSHMHAYLADGFHEQWLANLDRARRELPEDAMLLMGHGEPASGRALLDWQATYIDRFLEALRSAVEKDGLQGDPLAETVTARMKAFLPNDDLLFLTRLSVAPMRDHLQPTNGRDGWS
jgi:glyoxylase-like metal-dependent hydrolase (beta-lactamase superfamily II)